MSRGACIIRVRITTPDNLLVSSGVCDNELTDLVVLDDFTRCPLWYPAPVTLLANAAIYAWAR